MASRLDLQDWIIEALHSKGGTATIVEVAKFLWEFHEQELRSSGDLFFTWQYDMRWACTRLRKQRIVQAAEVSDRGQWKLSSQIDKGAN
ncbi:MAG TPA: hypothetical protein VI279_04295 [Rhodocyclaceae bacterium]